MVIAHAATYLELALFAPPAGIVLFKVLQSVRERRPAQPSPYSKESTP